MPFKSKAQRRKFWAMADKGEIAESTVREWERETKDKNLPERIESKDSNKKAYLLDKVSHETGALTALRQLGLAKEDQ